MPKDKTGVPTEYLAALGSDQDERIADATRLFQKSRGPCNNPALFYFFVLNLPGR